MGRITDDLKSPATLANTDVDTEAEQLTTTETRCKAVQLKTPAANTDVVYFGFKSNVTTTTGWPLEAGSESMVIFGVNDLRDVFVIAGAVNQAVHASYWQ